LNISLSIYKPFVLLLLKIIQLISLLIILFILLVFNFVLRKGERA
jgi:hypothetical protein